MITLNKGGDSLQFLQAGRHGGAEVRVFKVNDPNRFEVIDAGDGK